MSPRRPIEKDVSPRRAVMPLEIVAERKARGRRAAGTFTVVGRRAAAAPMPGEVVKVLVRAGEAVEANARRCAVE